MGKEVFDRLFKIDSENDTVVFNPQLFWIMRIMENEIEQESLSYKTLGIKADYYKLCKQQIIDNTKLIVQRLQEIYLGGRKICSCKLIGYIDFNTLDQLEGTIKSAIDNGFLKYSDFSADENYTYDELDFEELLLNIKDRLKKKFKKTLSFEEQENSSLDTILPYYEQECPADDYDEETINNTYQQKKLEEVLPDGFRDEDFMSMVNLALNKPTEQILISLPSYQSFLTTANQTNINQANNLIIKQLINEENNGNFFKTKNLTVNELVNCCS